MNDFLSKVSGQIAGPILLGAFFPVVLFVTALILVVLPLTPYSEALAAVVSLLKIWEDKTSAALILTAVVLVLSVVLYMLNVPIIRLYEGYPWAESWIAGKLRRSELTRFDDATSLRAAIRDLRRENRAKGLGLDEGNLGEAERKVSRLLIDEYPGTRGLLLPTRLGNVIRSFETYPQHPYGMPAIAVWPRLQAVLPATYAQALDGAQTAFSFMLNCSFLSIILAVALTFLGLLRTHPFRPASDHAWIAWTVVFALLWRLFYFGAINRAAEWGTQVRTAFDLYRGALLTQLGYETKPETAEEERRMWDAINYKFAFPDNPYPEPPYKRQASSLIVEPSRVIVTFRRTVSMIGADTLRVKVRIENNDPRGLEATQVTLRDELTPGQTYIGDSSAVDGISTQPTELNPVRIEAGKVEAGQIRTVVYRVKVAATP